MKPLLYRVLSLYRYLYVLAILGIEISQIPHTSSIPFWTYRVGLHFLIASISRIDIYPSTLLLCSLMRYRSETWLSVYRFHSVVYRNLKWDFYDHLRSDNFCIVVNNHLLCKLAQAVLARAHILFVSIFFQTFWVQLLLNQKLHTQGWKIYWTSLAVTHLLLVRYYYARKISINI